MKYEYMCYHVPCDDLSKDLNEVGEAGWRLVSVIPLGDNFCYVVVERVKAD